MFNGPVARPVMNLLDVPTIAIASTAVVYSKSIELFGSRNFGWQFTATSDGATNLKVEIEQGIVRPTTEGSADTTNYATPENYSTVITITDEDLHLVDYGLATFRFVRLKITGLSGNDATTTLAAFISTVEQV